MPNSITCAVSMKMMSSTSTTSTKGVTLISARLDEPALRRRDPYPPPFVEIAMTLLPEGALRQVEKLHGEVVHTRTQFADLVAEEVIEDGCRNRGHQAEGRSHQSFGNARGDGAETGGALLSQPFERG